MLHTSMSGGNEQLAPHPSPLTPHPSPLTPHPSQLAARSSQLTTHGKKTLIFVIGVVIVRSYLSILSEKPANIVQAKAEAKNDCFVLHQQNKRIVLNCRERIE
jgi:hypothetical protein